jgi:hypothetical protein
VRLELQPPLDGCFNEGAIDDHLQTVGNAERVAHKKWKHSTAAPVRVGLIACAGCGIRDGTKYCTVRVTPSTQPGLGSPRADVVNGLGASGSIPDLLQFEPGDDPWPAGQGNLERQGNFTTPIISRLARLATTAWRHLEGWRGAGHNAAASLATPPPVPHTQIPMWEVES